jgi:rhamnulokinase
VILGRLRDGKVTLTEVHRFANTPIRTPDGLHWNLPGLYSEILAGLRAVGSGSTGPIDSVGIDSWAVDYGLVDEAGRLLGMPYHYRDARTDGVAEAVTTVVSRSEQYERTGIAQLPFNTLYQLVAQREAGDPALSLASSLLLMPDLLTYWLTGRRVTEYTNASTTGALRVDGIWDGEMLERLGLPARIFLPPAQPGTEVGGLRNDVERETGCSGVRVVLPASHDTAAAVAAVPVTGAAGRHAYISSGTWSLLGLELTRPMLSEEARQAGFTNEGGAGGTVRTLRNIMGLWLLQECRRSWARSGTTWSYEELLARADALPSPGVVIDVDVPSFLHPPDMPAAIAAQIRQTGQVVPEDHGALTRVILEGLALEYRQTLESAERLAGVSVEVVHVVGGGSRNRFLCQLTADACERPVLAGPVEATALGNVLTQMLGREVRDIGEIHEVAARSSDPVRYEPRPTLDWAERAHRLEAMRPLTEVRA